MGRIIKFIVIVAILLGAAAAFSYAGARVKLGTYLRRGELPPLGEIETRFALNPPPELPGRRLVWIFAYPRTQLQGLPSITIYVSATGNIVATRPSNLAARLEPYRRELP